MSDDYQVDPDDADAGTEKKLAAFPAPPVEECPIAFLGYFKGYVVFAMPEGEIREEKSSDIARLIKLDLFNRREGQQFLNYWRDADDKFQRDLAALWFIRQAREAGYWDRSRPQRGLGVWPGGHGVVILHRGQELWRYPAAPGGQVEVISIAKALREPKSPIYAMKAPAPAPEPASTIAEGHWLRAALDAWHWDAIGDDGLSGADVMAGWIMASLLGSVAPFRPHLLLYALMGSGKTTLIRLVHGALGALAGDVIDAFTPAGLANDLGGMARPVIIDEAEASPSTFNGSGPIEEALGLIRRMATGSGAVRKMGTIGGGSVTQTAVGAVMLAAVNPVKLGAADASRIAEIKLMPLNMPSASGSAFAPASDDQITGMIERARSLGPALLGRALEGSSRYLADVAMMKSAFREMGEDPRSADLVAALAAGRRLLISDKPLDEAEAAEEASFWRGMLASREAADTVQNPGRDAFAHMMAWSSGQHLHDRIATLGELVSRWVAAHASTEDISDIEDVMREHGLKLVRHAGDDGVVRPWLLVAHHAPGLERIFERTAWRDWRRTFGYLDMLGPDFKTRPGNQQRFGVGVQQRTTAIPLSPWLGLGRLGLGPSQ